MDGFVLTIDKDKFRSTNDEWNNLMLNDPWSVGYVSILIKKKKWEDKEEWEETYYASGNIRNRYIQGREELFNDITIPYPYNKGKYYALKWDEKKINMYKGRTKEDFQEKGRILYNAVKNNGFGLTLEECIECVRFRVICETWNGIILREYNTKGTLQTHFPDLTVKEVFGENDYIYAVDLEFFKEERLLCAIQVKPISYLIGKAPYLRKARMANLKKNNAYTQKFKVPVFTIASEESGEIFNRDILLKIKQLL